MIISRSYFKQIIDIPNAQKIHPSSELLGNKSELDLLISEYERDILIKVLGYHLYATFKSELETTQGSGLETVKTDSEQKWKDLMTGKDYEIDGVKKRWQGIIFKDGALDRSFIAYYVYAKFIKIRRAILTENGVIVISGKNSKVTGDGGSEKYIWAWNKFHDLAYKGDGGLVSLKEFIEDQNDLIEDTYPEYEPKDIKRLNIFSL